jgi:hypothetical protein
MKKGLGAILIGLGLLSIISSSLVAGNAPNISYVIGTFLPGLLFLIFGLVLRREKKPQAAERSAADAGWLAPADLAHFSEDIRRQEAPQLDYGGMFCQSSAGTKRVR